MREASDWAKDMGNFHGEDCENVSMKDRVEQIQRDALFYVAMLVKEDGQIHASELIMDEVKKLRK